MAYNKDTGVLTGTTGAQFVVARTSAQGVIGYRDLGGSFRVRVEPFVDYVSLPGWTQPELGQNRFSRVVTESNLAATVVEAAKALAAKPPVSVSVAKALAAAGF